MAQGKTGMPVPPRGNTGKGELCKHNKAAVYSAETQQTCKQACLCYHIVLGQDV